MQKLKVAGPEEREEIIDGVTLDDHFKGTGSSGDEKVPEIIPEAASPIPTGELKRGTSGG